MKFRYISSSSNVRKKVNWDVSKTSQFNVAPIQKSENLFLKKHSNRCVAYAINEGVINGILIHFDYRRNFCACALRKKMIVRGKLLYKSLYRVQNVLSVFLSGVDFKFMICHLLPAHLI